MCSWACLPYGAATLLTEAKQPTLGRPLDLVGMSLLIVGIGALALSIVLADSPAWSRHELLGAAGIGLVSIFGFVAWARVATSPLVDLSLFRNATYRFVNLATLGFGIAFSMMFFAFFLALSELAVAKAYIESVKWQEGGRSCGNRPFRTM